MVSLKHYKNFYFMTACTYITSSAGAKYMNQVRRGRNPSSFLLYYIDISQGDLPEVCGRCCEQVFKPFTQNAAKCCWTAKGET